MSIKEQLTPLVFKKESETLSLSGIARKYGVSKQYITQLHTEYKTQYPEKPKYPLIGSKHSLTVIPSLKSAI